MDCPTGLLVDLEGLLEPDSNVPHKKALSEEKSSEKQKLYPFCNSYNDFKEPAQKKSVRKRQIVLDLPYSTSVSLLDFQQFVLKGKVQPFDCTPFKDLSEKTNFKDPNDIFMESSPYHPLTSSVADPNDVSMESPPHHPLTSSVPDPNDIFMESSPYHPLTSSVPAIQENSYSKNSSNFNDCPTGHLIDIEGCYEGNDLADKETIISGLNTVDVTFNAQHASNSGLKEFQKSSISDMFVDMTINDDTQVNTQELQQKGLKVKLQAAKEFTNISLCNDNIVGRKTELDQNFKVSPYRANCDVSEKRAFVNFIMKESTHQLKVPPSVWKTPSPRSMSAISKEALKVSQLISANKTPELLLDDESPIPCYFDFLDVFTRKTDKTMKQNFTDTKCNLDASTKAVNSSKFYIPRACIEHDEPIENFMQSDYEGIKVEHLHESVCEPGLTESHIVPHEEYDNASDSVFSTPDSENNCELKCILETSAVKKCSPNKENKLINLKNEIPQNRRQLKSWIELHKENVEERSILKSKTVLKKMPSTPSGQRCAFSVLNNVNVDNTSSISQKRFNYSVPGLETEGKTPRKNGTKVAVKDSTPVTASVKKKSFGQPRNIFSSKQILKCRISSPTPFIANVKGNSTPKETSLSGMQSKISSNKKQEISARVVSCSNKTVATPVRLSLARRTSSFKMPSSFGMKSHQQELNYFENQIPQLVRAASDSDVTSSAQNKPHVGPVKAIAPIKQMIKAPTDSILSYEKIKGRTTPLTLSKMTMKSKSFIHSDIENLPYRRNSMTTDVSLTPTPRLGGPLTPLSLKKAGSSRRLFFPPTPKSCTSKIKK